jgi:hypothetical protein
MKLFLRQPAIVNLSFLKFTFTFFTILSPIQNVFSQDSLLPSPVSSSSNSKPQGSSSMVQEGHKKQPNNKVNPVPNINEPSLVNVYLSLWTATLGNDQVILNWRTTSDLNCSHHTIQRSLNGLDFQDAALIFTDEQSQGSVAYSFTDKLIKQRSGTVYYRLKIVDKNYSSKYSTIRKVDFE